MGRLETERPMYDLKSWKGVLKFAAGMCLLALMAELAKIILGF